MCIQITVLLNDVVVPVLIDLNFKVFIHGPKYCRMPLQQHSMKLSEAAI